MPDGSYKFYVRGDGESTEDVASFVVDTRPPTVSFASPPPPLALSPQAELQFSAQDASAVGLECKLERGDGDGGDQTTPSGFTGLQRLGHWEACSSPLMVAAFSVCHECPALQHVFCDFVAFRRQTLNSVPRFWCC
jgi:hypothetical protein